MAERLADVEERAGRLILTSSSRTAIGLWQYNGWFEVLDGGVSDAELGAAVAAALEQSTLREPDDEAIDAVRRAVGARSYADLVRGTRHVSVAALRRRVRRFPTPRFQDLVHVEPFVSEGPRGGFTPLGERDVELAADVGGEELGAAVRRALGDAVPYGEVPAPAHGADTPSAAVGFGRKTAWLAIRDAPPAEVADALSATAVRRETWKRGLDALTGPAVFITPAVDGWTLVVLGDGAADADLDLAGLSARFGEAQKFGSHRVVDWYEWQRWVDGEAVRRYCYVGESGDVRFDEGIRAAAEREWDEETVPDEEAVLDVAAEWSVDPMTIDGRVDVAPEGLLGRLAR